MKKVICIDEIFSTGKFKAIEIGKPVLFEGFDSRNDKESELERIYDYHGVDLEIGIDNEGLVDFVGIHENNQRNKLVVFYRKKQRDFFHLTLNELIDFININGVVWTLGCVLRDVIFIRTQNPILRINYSFEDNSAKIAYLGY
jgi:hypothetical protein